MSPSQNTLTKSRQHKMTNEPFTSGILIALNNINKFNINRNIKKTKAQQKLLKNKVTMKNDHLKIIFKFKVLLSFVLYTLYIQ